MGGPLMVIEDSQEGKTYWQFYSMNKYTFGSKNPHFSREPNPTVKIPLAHTFFHLTINRTLSNFEEYLS